MKTATVPKEVLVPSDALSGIREFLQHFEVLAPLLQSMYQVRVVLDASTVIADVRWLVLHRRQQDARTALQEAMASGALVAYAPPVLRAEVLRRLPEIAHEEQLSLDALVACWKEYESQVFICEPEPGHCANPVDPDDLPYVYLYQSVAAAAVLTYDPHHAAMGVPTVQLDFVLSMRSYARNASLQVSVMLGSTAIVAGTLMAGASLLQLLVKGAQRLPKGVLIALGIGTLIVALHPKARAKAMDLAARALKPLEPVGKVIAKATLDVLTQAHQAGLVASNERAKTQAQVRPAPATARSIAFAVLAAEQEPLSFAQLLARMRHAGYRSEAKSHAAYLRRVLRTDQRFVESSQGWMMRVAA